MTIFIVLVVILVHVLFAHNVFGDDRKVFSFQSAKKSLYTMDFKQDFYCGCSFSKGKIDFKHCDFKDPKNSSRSRQVEAEHVVPASWFGRNFKEYRLGDKRCKTSKGVLYSGRLCLLKISPEYKMIHNDFHNLKPTVGSANGARSDLSYCEIAGEDWLYQGCDFERSKGKCVEPRESVRGDIARVFEYMNRKYPKRVIIPEDLKPLLKQWNESDPVDKRECRIDSQIYSVQRNHNPFVYSQCGDW